MALVSFGQTIRGAGAGVSFKNATTGGSATNLGIPAYGVTQVAPGANEIFSFELIDDYTRNPRHPQVNQVTSTGGQYKDDFAALASLISTGKIVTYTASLSGTTWTVGSTAAFTATTDGSVFFT